MEVELNKTPQILQTNSMSTTPSVSTASFNSLQNDKHSPPQLPPLSESESIKLTSSSSVEAQETITKSVH